MKANNNFYYFKISYFLKGKIKDYSRICLSEAEANKFLNFFKTVTTIKIRWATIDLLKLVQTTMVKFNESGLELERSLITRKLEVKNEI